MNNSRRPILIEPGVKYFLDETLKNCHENKKTYFNKIVNVSLFIFFISLISLTLYIKYKGKLTPRERKIKDRKIQEYLISKLKVMEVDRRRNRQDLITNLPVYKSEFEAAHRNLYQ